MILAAVLVLAKVCWSFSATIEKNQCIATLSWREVPKAIRIVPPDSNTVEVLLLKAEPALKKNGDWQVEPVLVEPQLVRVEKGQGMMTARIPLSTLIRLPQGKYRVLVRYSDWRYTIRTKRLKSLTPVGEVEAGEADLIVGTDGNAESFRPIRSERK